MKRSWPNDPPPRPPRFGAPQLGFGAAREIVNEMANPLLKITKREMLQRAIFSLIVGITLDLTGLAIAVDWQGRFTDLPFTTGFSIILAVIGAQGIVFGVLYFRAITKGQYKPEVTK